MEEKKVEVISPGDKCADLGSPGCLEIPDDRYTLNFDDIGEGSIKFCAHCGPKNFELQEALEKAFAIRGPEFVKKFEEALTAVEEDIQRRRS